jgi:hypothetical protein
VIVGKIRAQQPAGHLLSSGAAAKAVNRDRTIMAAQAQPAVGIDLAGYVLTGVGIDIQRVRGRGERVVPQRCADKRSVGVSHDRVVRRVDRANKSRSSPNQIGRSRASIR